LDVLDDRSSVIIATLSKCLKVHVGVQTRYKVV